MDESSNIDVLPLEVEMQVIRKLANSFMDLKNYALTSKRRQTLVGRYLTPIATRARDALNLGPELSKQDIIERLYHVNGYVTAPQH
jgi:hypothetical protein